MHLATHKEELEVSHNTEEYTFYRQGKGEVSLNIFSSDYFKIFFITINAQNIKNCITADFR